MEGGNVPPWLPSTTCTSKQDPSRGQRTRDLGHVSLLGEALPAVGYRQPLPCSQPRCLAPAVPRAARQLSSLRFDLELTQQSRRAGKVIWKETALQNYPDGCFPEALQCIFCLYCTHPVGIQDLNPWQHTSCPSAPASNTCLCHQA